VIKRIESLGVGQFTTDKIGLVSFSFPEFNLRKKLLGNYM
jgi:hypothetical protein